MAPGVAVKVALQVPSTDDKETLAAVVVTLAFEVPPQLLIEMVALLFTVNVAVVVPCPVSNTAPGVQLQV